MRVLTHCGIQQRDTILARRSNKVRINQQPIAQLAVSQCVDNHVSHLPIRAGTDTTRKTSGLRVRAARNFSQRLPNDTIENTLATTRTRTLLRSGVICNTAAQLTRVGLPHRTLHHQLTTLWVEKVLVTRGKRWQFDLIERDDLRHKIIMRLGKPAMGRPIEVHGVLQLHVKRQPFFGRNQGFERFDDRARAFVQHTAPVAHPNSGNHAFSGA